jgi:hypothetical protein
MANMELYEVLEDIDIVFRQLEFAIKLLSFAELENIDPKAFDTDHVVMLERGSLHFPAKHFSDTDSIIQAANIFVLIAFSASALVLDKGFEVIGMKRDPEARDNVGRLRALTYMIRCAQAHSVSDPRWEVRGEFARVLTVDLGDGDPISLDLTQLHGQRFHIDQLGGYIAWYKIRDTALQVFSMSDA